MEIVRSIRFLYSLIFAFCLFTSHCLAETGYSLSSAGTRDVGGLAVKDHLGIPLIAAALSNGGGPNSRSLFQWTPNASSATTITSPNPDPVIYGVGNFIADDAQYREVSLDGTNVTFQGDWITFPHTDEAALTGALPFGTFGRLEGGSTPVAFYTGGFFSYVGGSSGLFKFGPTGGDVGELLGSFDNGDVATERYSALCGGVVNESYQVDYRSAVSCFGPDGSPGCDINNDGQIDMTQHLVKPDEVTFNRACGGIEPYKMMIGYGELIIDAKKTITPSIPDADSVTPAESTVRLANGDVDATANVAGFFLDKVAYGQSNDGPFAATFDEVVGGWIEEPLTDYYTRLVGAAPANVIDFVKLAQTFKAGGHWWVAIHGENSDFTQTRIYVFDMGPIDSGETDPLSATAVPSAAAVVQGDPLSFTSVVAGGVAPYGYQWIINGSEVAGETNSTLTVDTNVLPVGDNTFAVKVTDSSNPSQTVTSPTVTVSVGDGQPIAVVPKKVQGHVGAQVILDGSNSTVPPGTTIVWRIQATKGSDVRTLQVLTNAGLTPSVTLQAAWYNLQKMKFGITATIELTRGALISSAVEKIQLQK